MFLFQCASDVSLDGTKGRRPGYMGKVFELNYLPGSWWALRVLAKRHLQPELEVYDWSHATRRIPGSSTTCVCGPSPRDVSSTSPDLPTTIQLPLPPSTSVASHTDNSTAVAAAAPTDPAYVPQHAPRPLHHAATAAGPSTDAQYHHSRSPTMFVSPCISCRPQSNPTNLRLVNSANFCDCHHSRPWHFDPHHYHFDPSCWSCIWHLQSTEPRLLPSHQPDVRGKPQSAGSWTTAAGFPGALFRWRVWITVTLCICVFKYNSVTFLSDFSLWLSV